MIHPSVYVLSPNPSNDKPSRPNQPTPTKGRRVHQATSKPSNQIVLSPKTVDTGFAWVTLQATNKPSNQNHTTPCFPQRLSIFGLRYVKLANHTPSKGRMVNKKGFRG